MKNHLPVKIILCALLAPMLLGACSPKGLPGDSGLAVEYVGQPPQDVRIETAFMVPSPIMPGEAVVSAKGLPSGTIQFVLGLVTRVTAADKFKLDYEVYNNDGLVPTEIVGQPTSWSDSSSGQSIIMFTVRPTRAASFPDGPYQAKLLIDKKVIALINWRIGEETPGGTP